MGKKFRILSVALCLIMASSLCVHAEPVGAPVSPSETVYESEETGTKETADPVETETQSAETQTETQSVEAQSETQSVEAQTDVQPPETNTVSGQAETEPEDQQESETVQAKTAPEPMPEPEEKPALREGQARVEWVRQNQTVLSGYDYVLDESLAEGEYVIDREAVPGTDEVSGWSFYDASGLLVDRQQVSRVSLQAPVQGVVRYNGERAAIEGKVTAHGIERGLLPGIEDVGTLIWPVPDYTYVSRWMSEYHKGSDLIAPKGAPVYAMADGTVTEAQYHYSYGNCVVIQHGGGVSTLYSHLSEISVAAGDTVTQGELIGSVGSTGNSTGNHCHVEIRVDGQLQSLKDYFPDK